MCRSDFPAAVQVHPRPVNQYAFAVSRNSSLEFIDADKRNAKKGYVSVQTIIAVAFLDRYGRMNGMPCPTERGSTDIVVVRYLPSSTTYAKL